MTFSELGIELKNDTDFYTEKSVKISDIINMPIEVIEFKKDYKTKNGLRYVVRFKHDGIINIFFTDSKKIKAVLDHEKCQFPFETVIKSYPVGDNRAYMFT